MSETQTVMVRQVENARDFSAFFRFPWQLYRHDPNWTPVLLSMRREQLDKDKNPAWEYLEGEYFVAWRGDEAVGTIAAFVNHRHNEFHDENIAWFGFFETIDDANVARALLDTASDWAARNGFDALRGPQSFTTHDECGLLVEGFSRPVMLMSYNLPYYSNLIEQSGFHKVMDVFSFYFYYDESQYGQSRMAQRVDRIIERLKQRSNAVVRPIDSKNLRRDFALFKALYNDAWEANWGFTPMTDRELDALIESLAQFFDPSLACFAEVDGEPVGFLLAIPDFNQVLQHARPRPGVPEVVTLLRALWHWKLRPKITWIRIPLMGIKPEYRRMGLDLMMYHHIREVMRNRARPYHHVDSSWILETNQDLIGVLEKIGMKKYKTHRFYQKDLR